MSIIAAILPLTSPAFAQKPVLAWSARTGPDLQFIAGTAVDSNGNVFVAARTPDSNDPLNPAFRNSDVFVSKLSADGSTTLCSMTFGGSNEDIPRAMVLLPDGTVVVAGLTYSQDFPRVPNAAPPSSDDSLTFLTRVDPCQGKILLSTYLLGQPYSLAVGLDGTLYAAIVPVSGGDTGSVERMSATGSVLGSAPVRGIPYAVATDASGSVYASGLGVRITDNNLSSWKGFATKFSSDLNTISYDADIGEGRIALGTALTTGADGTLYVAGLGTSPGANLENLIYTDTGLSFDASSAILFAVRTDGSVAFTRYAALATPSLYYSQQRSIGAGLGPDGRIWMAITGALNYPLNLDGVPMNGIQLVAFDPSGAPAGGNSFVGGAQFNSSVVAAFSPSGRISEATFNPYLPVTPGSATSSAPNAISVVAFDLAGGAAPTLQADRDILDIDDVHLLNSPYARRDSKSVNVFLTDGSSGAFAANIVFAGAFEVPPPQPPLPVSSSTADQTLPGSITVSASADIQPFSPSPALVVLAPGAQGALTIPVRLRSRNFSLRLRQLDSFVFPTVSSQSATFAVAISVDEDTSTSFQSSVAGLNLPFKLTSQSPRVTFDLSEGTTPAQFDAIIDPSGLNPGTYSAQLSIDIGGSVQTQTLSWTIGPSIKLIVPGTFLDGRINPLWRVSNSQPSTQTITLDSTGDPINFTVQSLSSFLSVAPSQGQTPQDVTLTFMPMGILANQTVVASFQITTPGGSKFVSIIYYFAPPTGLIPDAISSPGAPGGLFTWIAYTSRCDVAELQSPPWPPTLGSCTIRMNSSPLPIGSITSPLSPVQSYWITAQLPYDVPLGLATMEIEDKTGRRSSLALTVQAVSPVWVGQPFVPSPSRKAYDPLTLNFTGLGVTDVPAPLGDVAASAVQPLARLEAFVGGRTARILSAQLSYTAVGVFDITIEVPPLAPDLYNVILKIDGAEIATGSVDLASSN